MMKSDEKEESMMLEPQNPEENMTNEEEESLQSGTPRIEEVPMMWVMHFKKLALHSMSAIEKDDIGDCQRKKQHNV